MGKPSIFFVIPTLFNRPERVNDCVEALYKNLGNFNYNFEVTVVTNISTINFEQFMFCQPVKKLSSGVMFNIAKALNSALKQNNSHDFFCYVDEGIRIHDIQWLDYAIELVSQQFIGSIGCRSHSTFEHYHRVYQEDPPLFEVLWSDGILLTRMNSIQALGGFDERYYADCELQDFGYRLHQAGYTNLHWQDLAEHETEEFSKKHKQTKKLIALRNRSRLYFMKRWMHFEKELGFETFKSKKLNYTLKDLWYRALKI